MVTAQCRIWGWVLSVVGFLVMGEIGQSWGYEVITVTDGGTIRGQVKLAGVAPTPEKVQITKDEETCGKTEKVSESLLVGADNGLQNVVVSIANIQKGKRQQREGALIDQTSCRYVPHVVLVSVGANLTLRNSDGILHNLHSHSTVNPPFNKPQPKFRKEIKEKFAAAEIIKLMCDSHAWMQGWIVVHEHPYFTVTDEAGFFSLTDIPSGNYELLFWHEVLGEKRELVNVSPGANLRVQVEMSE